MGTARFEGKRALQLLMVLYVVAAAEVIAPALGSQKSYVVYMGARSTTPSPLPNLQKQQQKLTSLFGSAVSESVIYSYSNFDAFAAYLSPEQAAALDAEADVISVFPNNRNELHTTHTWSFLGLEDDFGNVPENSLWIKSDYGKDVIIGVLDTGVWPESASFSDAGFGPIPAKWKGECVAGDQFGPANCNNKLIGGKYFIKGFEAAEGPLNTTASGDFRSARDSDGHGTHTMSTAGGNFAPNVSCLGFAPGTAKGGAPKSRVAMYKVCWPSTAGSGGCYDADILAAFDQGISDGVDVFSLSLGSNPPLNDLFRDAISIGSFHAVQQNMATICSAGNSGPIPSTVSNIAPWITTVAASSVDREFPSYAILGNGVSLKGQSLSNTRLDDGSFFPLAYSANIFASSSNATDSMFCLPGSLDPAKAAGKIVACMRGVTPRVNKGEVVKEAGGVGLLLMNPITSGNELEADPHVVPATALTYDQGVQVISYINSTASPVARLTPATTVLGVKPAPIVTAFSSQGPNSLIPDLLKPDITGPGLNILAAFTEATAITKLPGDTRIVKYNIISGTSMSCPHVAGTTASLRAYRPTWTPAAIRSAIMTTASIYDNVNELILNASVQLSTPFGLGSGAMAPNSAAEPGLVYDNEPTAYYEFLCSLKYTAANIFSISGQNYTCSNDTKSVSDFNYPSLTVSSLEKTGNFTRTVTNVGNANSVYTVSVVSPPGIKTKILPPRLRFSALGETKTFVVQFHAKKSTKGAYVFGSYTWSDGVYNVRSPIVIKTVL